MDSPNRENDHRYYLLFVLTILAVVVVLSQVAVVAANQLFLPLVYPSDQPVWVVNKGGTLSNGDRLTGWRLATYYASYGLTLAAVAAPTLVGLARVWPKKRPA